MVALSPSPSAPSPSGRKRWAPSIPMWPQPQQPRGAVQCLGERMAEPLYHRGLTIREKPLGPEHPDVATCLNPRPLYAKEGRTGRRSRSPTGPSPRFAKALGPEHPRRRRTSTTSRGCTHAREMVAPSPSTSAPSPSRGESARVPPSRHRRQALANLVLLYDTQGHYEQAEPLCRRAIAISEKTLGPNHPDTAIIRSFHAALLQKGRQPLNLS